MIVGGALLVAIALRVIDDGLADTAQLTRVALMLALTGGLLSCLAGALGASGVMAWIPGLDGMAAGRSGDTEQS
jgi:hypothetical protein